MKKAIVPRCVTECKGNNCTTENNNLMRLNANKLLAYNDLALVQASRYLASLSDHLLKYRNTDTV